jgi:acetyl-CoA acetyltransferase
MQDIFIIGVGMTPFGRMLDVDLKTMTRQATDAALADAGIDKSDLEGAYFANVSQGHMERQHMIRGEIVLRSMGIGGIPVINVENACASGSSAFNSAVNFVRAGQGDVALAVGAEKMYSRDRDLMFSVFDSGWDVSTRDETVARLAKMGEGVKVPGGTMSTKPYSVFMDVYAAFSRFHMKRFGTTREQLAAVAAKNHDHSIHNPQSQYRNGYTVEEVLAAPPIAYPLTLPMCAPISDGAAAVIVCNKSGLSRLGACPSNRIFLDEEQVS